jgi:hypothetical protein
MNIIMQTEILSKSQIFVGKVNLKKLHQIIGLRFDNLDSRKT